MEKNRGGIGMPVYRFYFDNNSVFVKKNLKRGYDYTKCFAIFYCENEEKARTVLEDQCKLPEGFNNAGSAWDFASVSTDPGTKRYNEIFGSLDADAVEQLIKKHERLKDLVCSGDYGDMNSKYYSSSSYLGDAWVHLEQAQDYGKNNSLVFMDHLLKQALYVLHLQEIRNSKIVDLYQMKANIQIGMLDNKGAQESLLKALDLLKKFEAGDKSIHINDLQPTMPDIKISHKQIDEAYKNINSNLEFVGYHAKDNNIDITAITSNEKSWFWKEYGTFVIIMTIGLGIMIVAWLSKQM